MALFGKSKTVSCAICGAEAKTGLFRGLFQKKIEGQYVCKECYGDVDLPAGAMDHMTIEQFKEYMAFRTENQKLRGSFQATHEVDVGRVFSFDLANRLLCTTRSLSTTIFTADNIRSFVIREDDQVIFQGDSAVLVCNPSQIPERIRAITPEVQFAQMQLKLYRTHLNSAPEEKKEEIRKQKPEIKLEDPLGGFYVDIQLEHPYWPALHYTIDAPQLDCDDPSITEYSKEYAKQYASLEKLADCLTALAFPNAQVLDNRPSTQVSSAQPAKSAAAKTDPVGELKRYKELLDLGILTQEEFNAKKQQLLGL